MTMKLKAGLLAALVAVAGACGTKEAPGPLDPLGPIGRVRFVNLVTDPSRNPVNAILENVIFGVNLGYTATTPATLASPSGAPYASILTGSRSLVLKKTADTTIVLATIGFTIAEGENRTVYATGGTGGAAVANFVTTDPTPAGTAGQAQVRLVNMAAGGSLDYFITAPNADLAAATPVATLAYQEASGYIALSPGTYQVRAVPAGTLAAARSSSVSVTLNSLALASAAARTVITATNASGATPLTAFSIADR